MTKNNTINNTIQRVLIVAGGSGGHVFPALAIAKRFCDKGVEVQWLGTRKGLEYNVSIKQVDVAHLIEITGLRGKGWKDIVFAPWRLIKATFEAMQVIRRVNPDIVIGMGGFVSGPGGIASVLLGKKLIIHEQNALPGLTNRCLSFVATRVLQGFPNTFKPGKKIMTTGNPIRSEIATFPSPVLRFGTDNDNDNNKKAKLLVFGGSLGAQIFNELVPQALSKIPVSLRPEVWHQTGEIAFADTAKRYQELKVNAKIAPFIVANGQGVCMGRYGIMSCRCADHCGIVCCGFGGYFSSFSLCSG